MTQANDRLSITPPFGYGDVVPVLNSQRIRPPAGLVPPALRRTNAIPVTMAEIGPASRHYPVIFASADNGRSFGVVALVGLANNENLFLGPGNTWVDGVYQPAYLRRYPFCMATVTTAGQQQDERIVCVASEALDDANGQPLLDADGKNLPWWDSQRHLVLEYEADLIRTQQMCDLLAKLDVLRPFGAQAISKSGAITNLAGMYRVEESLLERLKADDLRMLIGKGIMSRLYAHMISLDNLGALLDRQPA